jgi:hypothetical protein
MTALATGMDELATPDPHGSADLTPFGRLFAASAVSNLGDGLRLTALPLLAASLTRDPATIATVSAVLWLPWLLFGAFGGAIACVCWSRCSCSGCSWWVGWRWPSGPAGLAAAGAGMVNSPLLFAALLIPLTASAAVIIVVLTSLRQSIVPAPCLAGPPRCASSPSAQYRSAPS